MNAVVESVRIPVTGVRLDADVAVPEAAKGVVLFAHGSGSGRHSPRNRFVAGELQAAGIGTVLADLLTREEERTDAVTGELRFDIGLLAARVTDLADWLGEYEPAAELACGLFGASTGAAAALVAASVRPDTVRAVVSRGGRPDLAGSALASVRRPTLLIVGGRDQEVLRLNQDAMRQIPGETRLEVVPGATHLFEEPGTLERVAHLACDWFTRRLPG
ncbi:MAG: dienelactone hydrolase family protein [Streptomyces sp.]|uniref:dienelactone hydrolase family protein n=1 Tax=Streptomyces sp. TaxID=1931 RepID=UPI0025E4574B|nr:dienelactone hydrolase family protein [Streptomyces sp.]MBW8798475.1 dienelactone hydrolase family protein [Streptomyces sp.]